MVFERGLSTVCGDPLVAFEDVWSERRVIMSFFSEAVFNEHRYSQDGQTRRLVLHCLLSTVCDDLLVAFEQAWSGEMVLERRLSRICGDFFIDLENVWLKMGAQALGRVFEPWRVRI